MADNNSYKYELKIQAMTEQIASLNNQVLDARVELTVLSKENDSLKEQLQEITDVSEENKKSADKSE